MFSSRAFEGVSLTEIDFVMPLQIRVPTTVLVTFKTTIRLFSSDHRGDLILIVRLGSCRSNGHS